MKIDPSIDPEFSADPAGLNLRVLQLPGGLFSMQWRAARGLPYSFATKLNFDEMIGNVIRIASEGRVPGRNYEDRPEQMIRNGEVPPGYAAVIMPVEQMQFFSDRLSDLGCWIAGFKAALDPERYDRAPYGGDHVSELNLRIKSAIEKVKS